MPIEKDLTVGEVMEALRKFPPEATLYTEGCDCSGTVGSVSFYGDDGDVFLWRPKEMDVRPPRPVLVEVKPRMPRSGDIMQYKGLPVLVRRYVEVTGMVFVKRLDMTQNAELWVPWDALT